MWSPSEEGEPTDVQHRPSTGRDAGTFAPASTPAPVNRVLVLVEHRRNRTLLLEWFAGRATYEAVDGTTALRGAAPPLDGSGAWVDDNTETSEEVTTTLPNAEQVRLDSEPFDIVLVDVTALERNGAWLRRRVERERPLPLPCLLLASESTSRQFFGPSASHGWDSLVDDVITTPVDSALLDRRVRAYLELRRQATALDRRHDQLSLLAQVVRHDIANAATVVTGWGELLREEVSPAGIDALERVLRGGQRITEIVENSRDLTMLIDAGHDLETEVVLLGPVLQVEVEAIRRIHASTTRSVVVELQSPLPTVEVVAGGMLPSVFANLLSNAVRHNDAETTDIGVTVDVDEAEVVVRLRDNGPGIPDAQKEQVFQPATKRGDSPGDGLGLSLVKRLVESYGGRVWFEDADGGGAVACVALRRAAPS